MLKMIIILLLVVCFGAYISFFERRLLGLFQNRYGPNRVGWCGSLQLFADMVKILFKEDWVPPFSDRFIFILAPVITFVSLLMIVVIIPFGVNCFVSDLNVGVLFFFNDGWIISLWSITCRLE